MVRAVGLGVRVKVRDMVCAVGLRFRVKVRDMVCAVGLGFRVRHMGCGSVPSSRT